MHATRATLVVLFLALAGVGDVDGAAPPGDEAPTNGLLTILTYNVAGLPSPVSASAPHRNTAVIGRRINGYDLVLVQEDFCYHRALEGGAGHSFRSAPEHDPGCTILLGSDNDLGDGLNRFSASPIVHFERRDWSSCHGFLSCHNDCMGSKGFTVGTHVLGSGLEIDVYNVHMDAGICSGDFDARRSQHEQLARAIVRRSSGRAVIVGGDLNLTNTQADRRTTARFLERTGLKDLCAATRCRAGARLDRILFRSGESVELLPATHELPARFNDAGGEPLSDHAPILGRLRWQATPTTAAGLPPKPPSAQ